MTAAIPEPRLQAITQQLRARGPMTTKHVERDATGGIDVVREVTHPFDPTALIDEGVEIIRTWEPVAGDAAILRLAIARDFALTAIALSNDPMRVQPIAAMAEKWRLDLVDRGVDL